MELDAGYVLRLSGVVLLMAAAAAAFFFLLNRIVRRVGRAVLDAIDQRRAGRVDTDRRHGLLSD